MIDCSKVVPGFSVKLRLLAVKDYPGDVRPSEVQFNSEVFEMQGQDPPYRMTKRKTAMAIGNSMAKCLDVDTEGAGGAMGNKLRMRVETDISKPLRRVVTLKVQPDKEAKRFYIRYERLQNFCGVLGHGYEDCDKEEDFDEDILPFGDWLRVNSTAPRPEYKHSDVDNQEREATRQIQLRGEENVRRQEKERDQN